jgi:hypothetical protein
MLATVSERDAAVTLYLTSAAHAEGGVIEGAT